jgi:uncharacterized protein (DUF2252 family)
MNQPPSSARIRPSSAAQFREDPPLVCRVQGAERHFVEELMMRYKEGIAAERKAFLSRFQVKDAATWITGVAGVGKRNYLVLCHGLEGTDVILLRLIEALPAAYARWLSGPVEPTISEGARVVLGTRAAQTSPDPLLAWVDLEGTSFVFRAFSEGH